MGPSSLAHHLPDTEPKGALDPAQDELLTCSTLLAAPKPHPCPHPRGGDSSSSYALHSSPGAAHRCPPAPASALGPVGSGGCTHLHHSDAEAAHGAQCPSVLQLLRSLCVQLDLLLLLRGRDAQEVLGQLSDVYLQDRGVMRGHPPQAGPLPAPHSPGLQPAGPLGPVLPGAGCPAQGAPWRPEHVPA